MTRSSLLVIMLLAGPAFAASDVWRWQDSAGRLHYSNIPAQVPPDAEVVTTQLGHVSSLPRALATPKVQTETGRQDVVRREPRHHWGESRSPWGIAPAIAEGCCPPFGMQHILTTTGRSLADQVQEASLLDALNVRWRSPGCSW